MDYQTILSSQLRRPGRAPLAGSVMASTPAPEWQPEYEKEPPLEDVSPEDFIPNPKTVLAAAKGLPMIAGTFFGKGSTMWSPVKAAAASMNLRAGADPASVWKKDMLGTLPAPNAPEVVGELSDAKAKYIPNLQATKLSEVLHHPELYKHYPWLANYEFKHDNTLRGLGNQQSYLADRTRGIVRLNPDKIESPEGALSTLLHEAGGHAVQDAEGWIPGASFRYRPPTIGDLDKSHLPLISNASGITGVPYTSSDPALETLQNMLKKGSLYKNQEDELFKIFKDTLNNAATDRKAAFKDYSDTHGEAMARLIQGRATSPMSALREQYPFDPDYFQTVTGSAINELRNR